MTEECKVCRFYKKEDEEWGLCRRYAPKPMVEHAGLAPALLGAISKTAFNELPEDERWEGWANAIEASGDWYLTDRGNYIKWPLVSPDDFCGEFVSAI